MKPIYIFLLMAFSIGMFSCGKEFLDKAPLNQLTSDSYFKQDNDFALYTDGFYSAMTVQPSPAIWFDYRSDLVGQWQAKSGNRSYADLHNGNMTASTSSPGIYWDYGPIRNAYTLLNNIDNVELSANNKNLYLGTTYYLLAYRYFVMFRAYESVPIVKSVLEIKDADVGSSPKEEVFAEALGFVNKAIEALPSLGPNERVRGRLTKLVAMTLKTEMLLYTASYYNESIAGATWKDAAAAATAALAEADNKAYGLSNDFNSLFIADKQSGTEPQKEIIFEYVRLKDVALNSFSYYNFGPHKNNIGWGDFPLTQECVDMFDCTDGKPIGKSAVYDPAKPFNNRDPRFTLTTLYPGRITAFADGNQWIVNTLSEFEYDNDGNKTAVVNNDYMKTLGSSIDRSPSGYINIKYWDRYNGRNGGHASFINYRYGELLLMYAEAMNEAYGPSAEVYDALTMLRTRPTVDLPAVSAAEYPTQATLREFIRKERVCELVCEGKRYWDLKRWHLLDTRLNMSHYSMHIAKTFDANGNATSYMDKLWIGTSLSDPAKGEYFDIPNGANGGELMHTSIFPGAKYYVWPIPENAINRSTTGALKQNPLWQ
ncbi:MAG: RagB/SusD family nutrient uptake outer membrane protein [Agriterribacter sp.]